ncbi:hypothetical protein JH06_1265 [Blastocystis sp. subtype 4]|uniref:hypothetical protein n=1 Tax=Blastocystis sp. subtype 4 TaxID=944170 RepID=UPI00071182F5|nr:hypothetical protein JH06_1265 [Blastocystis sp. subtype 4]KNB45143.1 hypothetical protein JH06_1265 [Blastocystis sp. subtype 4]|eukprot:XP_014528586.1 hypothetical protein JH06_1265 [Blastocystis sp. subtype 4]
MKVAQTVINGINDICIICSFRHQCSWGGNVYAFPIDLIIPRTFPMTAPEFYIRPEPGSRIFPIPNVVDESGKIISYLVQNLRSGYPLTQFFVDLHASFGNSFPVCADNRPQLIGQLKQIMQPEFIAKYEAVLRKNYRYYSFEGSFKELSVLQGQLRENAATIEDATNTVINCNSELVKKDEALSAELDKKKEMEKQFADGPKPVEDDYRTAFSFSSDNQQLYMELDSCERAGNDLHDLLYSSLNKSNTEEVLDVLIRENGKEIFEAHYLKEVVKARMGTTANYQSTKSFLPSVPVLARVGPPTF